MTEGGRQVLSIGFAVFVYEYPALSLLNDLLGLRDLIKMGHFKKTSTAFTEHPPIRSSTF
jgi:hypothetical protein